MRRPHDLPRTRSTRSRAVRFATLIAALAILSFARTARANALTDEARAAANVTPNADTVAARRDHGPG